MGVIVSTIFLNFLEKARRFRVVPSGDQFNSEYGLSARVKVGIMLTTIFPPLAQLNMKSVPNWVNV